MIALDGRTLKEHTAAQNNPRPRAMLHRIQLVFLVCLLSAFAGCSEAKEEKRLVALVSKEGYVDQLPSEKNKAQWEKEGALPVYATVQLDARSGKPKAYRTWLYVGDKVAGSSPWVVTDTLFSYWRGIFVTNEYQEERFIKLEWPQSTISLASYGGSGLVTTVVTQRWVGTRKGSKEAIAAGVTQATDDLASFQLTLRLRSLRGTHTIYPVFFLADQDVLHSEMRAKSASIQTNESRVVSIRVSTDEEVAMDVESPYLTLGHLRDHVATKVVHIPRGWEVSIPPLPSKEVLFPK